MNPLPKLPPIKVKKHAQGESTGLTALPKMMSPKEEAKRKRREMELRYADGNWASQFGAGVQWARQMRQIECDCGPLKEIEADGKPISASKVDRGYGYAKRIDAEKRMPWGKHKEAGNE